MKSNKIMKLKLAVAVALSALAAKATTAATLSETQSFTVTGGVTQAVFSDQYNLLFLRDGGSDVRVIDLATQTQIGVRNPNSATSSFTVFKLSPSGRYLYAA